MDKEEFLEKALKANEGAISQSKLSDMTDKDSSFYRGVNVMPQEIPEAKPVAPIDPEAIPQIRTLQADVADAVKTDQLSLSRIALAEAKKKESTEKNAPDQKKSWVGASMIALGIMFVLGGIGAVGYTVYNKYSLKPVVEVPNQEVPMIRYDAETILSFKNANIRTIQTFLEKELKNPPTQDNLRRVKSVTENDGNPTPVTFVDLMGIGESGIPDELLRNLKPEFFMGFNFIKGQGEPFLIIESDNFEQIYPGLLAWEAAMREDLGFIFMPPPGNLNSIVSFSDKVVANKNVRIGSNEDGSLRFFYSVVDETKVIFAKSQTTFEEILKRLRERKPVNSQG